MRLCFSLYFYKIQPSKHEFTTRGTCPSLFIFYRMNCFSELLPRLELALIAWNTSPWIAAEVGRRKIPILLKSGGKTRSAPFCDGYAGYQCEGGGINQFSDGVRTAKASRGGRRGLERPRHSRAGKRKRNTSLTHVTSNSDFLLAPAPRGRLLLAV